MSMPHVFWRHLSKSAISQLLLTQFWTKFSVSFLGPSLTDVNCHGDICPGHIWPGDICPYQQFRQHLTRRHFSISAISQLLLNQFWQNFRFKFSWAFFDRCHTTDDICTMNLCPDNNTFCPSTKPNIDQSVWTLNLFVSFIPICVWTKIFLEQNIVFIPKFWTKMFFDQNFCSSKVCFLNNFDFLTKRFKIKILSGPTFKLS